MPPKAKAKNRVNKKARKTTKRKAKKPVKGIAAFVEASPLPWFDTENFDSLKAAKLLIGLLLLPVCWVSFETFLVLFQTGAIDSNLWKQPEFVFFAIGLLFSIVLFFGVRSPAMMWLYVAGHELTHALFVLICRGNVSKIHISSKGGHILTNRNNFVISLSPYFFPFYTACLIAIWSTLEWLFFDFTRQHTYWLYGLIGITWMFHLAFTVWMVFREQPDVEQNGKIFSFSVVFLANMVLISALLIMASPTATFRSYGKSFVANTESFATRLWESVLELWSVLPV